MPSAVSKSGDCHSNFTYRDTRGGLANQAMGSDIESWSSDIPQRVESMDAMNNLQIVTLQSFSLCEYVQIVRVMLNGVQELNDDT